MIKHKYVRIIDTIVAICYTQPVMNPHQRLLHLVEHLNDAVYTVDAKTLKFTSLNPAGATLTGYTQEELIGGLVTSIIAPESLNTVKKMIGQKMRKNLPTIYEVELIRKDGRRIPIEISSRMLYEKGEPVEILGIARDITERKLAERQKEIFFSLITHEIKNPLTSISMYTQLLRKKAQKEQDMKDAEMLNVIESQVTAITQLMSDFMEVNQLQLKQFTIKKEPFDLNAVVNEVTTMFSKRATKHTIKKLGKVKQLVNADRQRIYQVLVNLVSNAIKYSAPGSTVTIKVKESTNGIRVSVIDQGLGIAKEEQKAVFDLFYRIAQEKQQSIKGHGLGLYICQEIIHSHNGSITLTSEVGKGSTFSFYIPL